MFHFSVGAHVAQFDTNAQRGRFEWSIVTVVIVNSQAEAATRQH
jgi:hypothetical protein